MHNAIDWCTPLDKMDGYNVIRLKNVLQIGLRMIRINENNKLSIKYNKKHAIDLGFVKIDDEDMNKIIEDVHRRDEFDKDFDIGVACRCKYYDDSSNNEQTNNKEEGDGFFNKCYWCLPLYCMSVF